MTALLTSYCCWCQGPTPFNKDSILKVLAGAREDTNKVLLLINVGSIYELNQPDSAKYYYQAAGNLSQKLDYKVGTLKYISYYTAVLNVEGKYFETLNMNLQAVELAKKINNKLQQAVAYCNVGASYYGLKNYTGCIDCFLKAEVLLNQLGDSTRLVVIYSNLTGLYNEINQDEKSYLYGLKSIRLSKAVNDDYTLVQSLENTAQALTDMKRLDTALVLLKQSAALAKKVDDRLHWTNVGMNIAEIYYLQERYAEMKQTADESLAVAKTINNNEVISQALLFIARYYFFNSNYSAAKAATDQALSLAIANNAVDVGGDAYAMLANIALATGKLQDFRGFKNKQDSVQEIMVSDKIIKNTQEIEAKYSLAKKEAQIGSLNDEKKIQALTIKQSHTANIALAVTIVILALAGFLFYRNTQNKRKLSSATTALQEQRIAELEMEKQFLAAQAVLQGQDEERSRLAKDLHDGLGGILSSAKYSFGNMKNNFIITGEGAEAFDKSMAMLDKSITELRAVSHNMMPEALVKFGLDTALKDYCNSLDQTSPVQITYQSFEVNDENIDKSTASVIYRIVQELLNNILKHAGAATALVQLVQKENALSITVEDDGKGFDKTLLQTAEGIGFKNIYNRVNYLKGSIDFDTAPTSGTSVTIEIPNVA